MTMDYQVACALVGNALNHYCDERLKELVGVDGARLRNDLPSYFIKACESLNGSEELSPIDFVDSILYKNDGNAYITNSKTIKESKVFDCLVFEGRDFAIIKEAEFNQKKSDFISEMNQYLKKAEIPQAGKDEIEKMCFEKDMEGDHRPILYKCHKTGIVAILGEDCLGGGK